MLTTQQIQSFVDHNYIVLEDCFSAETVQEWVENACQQTGIDLKDGLLHLATTPLLSGSAYD